MIKNTVKTPQSVSDVCAPARARESEKKIEAALVDGVKRRGGMAIKLTSQFQRGLPDRLVILPYRTVSFVELKSTGEHRTAVQEAMGKKIEALGFRVFVIDSSLELWEYFCRMDKRIERIRKSIEEKTEDEVPTA